MSDRNGKILHEASTDRLPLASDHSAVEFKRKKNKNKFKNRAGPRARGNRLLRLNGLTANSYPIRNGPQQS